MKLFCSAISLAAAAAAVAWPCFAAAMPNNGIWQPAATNASGVTIASASVPAPAYVDLFSSRAYTADSDKAQNFQDNLALKPNQEKLPLQLTINNGADGKQAYKWFRLSIGGYQLASDADMKGASSKTFDITGRMTPGGGQIILQAGGQPGATLSFSLKTPAVVLHAVHPKVVRHGEELTLFGKNFSSDELQDSVVIGGTKAPVLSASRNSITILVPRQARLGKNDVYVSVNSLDSGKLPIVIQPRVAPEILGTDYWMAPPGAALTITGENFSQNSSDNQVYFGNVQANVIASTEDTIIVEIPQWQYGQSQLNIPLTVVADGVRSSNALPFDIGPKYLAGPPIVPGDSYSSAGSQASSAASSQATTQSTSQSSSQHGSQSGSETGLQVQPGQ